MTDSVFWKFLALRVVNALCVNTYFNPDEYWQSVEVAHRLVFGYGHLTWEWTERIRGFVHPLVFAAVYYILKITGLDYPMVVVCTHYSVLSLCSCDHVVRVCVQVLAPRVLQAVLAATADTFLCRIVAKYNENLAKKTMYCIMFSWFLFFCDVRTFSNTMEAQLSVIALYYWLVARDKKNDNVPSPVAVSGEKEDDDSDKKNKDEKPSEKPEEEKKSKKSKKAKKETKPKTVKTEEPADKKKEAETIVEPSSSVTEDEDDALSRMFASALSGLAFVMRPTAAIFFAPVVVLNLYWTFSNRSKVTFGFVFRVLILQMAMPVLLILAAATAVDSIVYGDFTFVPYNFLYHNVLHSVADFYGTHPWHWYVTQGFPMMLGPFVVLFLIGIFRPQGLPRVLLFICLWPLAIYSLLKHKEFRFVLTSLYLALPFCAAGLETMRFKGDNLTTFQKVRRFLRRAFVVVLFFWEVAMAYVFCFFYQRGPVAVMDTLTELSNMPPKELASHNLTAVQSVLFLCECHSTPYYAYVHTRPGLKRPPFSMRFLDCTPDFAHNLSTENVEDRVFQRNPAKFVFERYVSSVKGQRRQPLPSHIVSFSKYNKDLKGFYEMCGYQPIAVFPHDLESNVTLFHRKARPAVGFDPEKLDEEDENFQPNEMVQGIMRDMGF